MTHRGSGRVHLAKLCSWESHPSFHCSTRNKKTASRKECWADLALPTCRRRCRVAELMSTKNPHSLNQPVNYPASAITQELGLRLFWRRAAGQGTCGSLLFALPQHQGPLPRAQTIFAICEDTGGSQTRTAVRACERMRNIQQPGLQYAALSSHGKFIAMLRLPSANASPGTRDGLPALSDPSARHPCCLRRACIDLPKPMGAGHTHRSSGMSPRGGPISGGHRSIGGTLRAATSHHVAPPDSLG